MIADTDLLPAFLYTPDFFRTNRIFTDEDQRLVRQTLDYVVANVFDVQTLMQDVVDEDRIEDLSRQERELIDCIERCRVVLAPIKKLPDSVLRCIFIICCQLSPTEFLSRDSKSPLIALSQVCSAWRGIVLEIPFLWSQINLFYDWRFSHAYNLSYVEEAIKLWFARASTCPISLEAGVRSYGSTIKERELCDLVERIIALRPHYRKLVLRFSCERIDVLLGKLSPEQLWHLEELETVNTNPLVTAEILNPPFSPTTFGNLKKLIDAGYWNSKNISSILPFPRLQMLNIQTITMALALELFQQCPLLETCEIVLKSFDSTIRSRLAKETSYITLPQLRNVCMRFDSTQDCCRFIDRLVVSNLESLMIFASNETVIYPDEMVEHVVALSQRSDTPNIRVLYFNQKLIPILNPGILLRSLPHLENIVTDGYVTLDEETLDGLAMGIIGPCLRTLHTGDISEATDLDAIIKMAKQREQNLGSNDLLVTTTESGKGKLIAVGMQKGLHRFQHGITS